MTCKWQQRSRIRKLCLLPRLGGVGRHGVSYVALVQVQARALSAGGTMPCFPSRRLRTVRLDAHCKALSSDVRNLSSSNTLFPIGLKRRSSAYASRFKKTKRRPLSSRRVAATGRIRLIVVVNVMKASADWLLVTSAEAGADWVS